MTESSGDDRYEKYANFEGPDEDTRTRALRSMRKKQGHGGGMVHGGNVGNDGSHRTWKHRPAWMK